LVVHAHPDDEVFATGAATIALAAAGWRVVLRVATGGEAAESRALSGLDSGRLMSRRPGRKWSGSSRRLTVCDRESRGRWGLGGLSAWKVMWSWRRFAPHRTTYAERAQYSVAGRRWMSIRPGWGPCHSSRWWRRRNALATLFCSEPFLIAAGGTEICSRARRQCVLPP
jgi:hypothetical protein